jgi:adenosine deaminase
MTTSTRSPLRPLRTLTVLASLLAATSIATAAPAVSQRLSAEEATARYMESIRDRPPLLVAFLREMPKGADLHSHLSGAVYAESFLRWAAEDGSCVSVRAMSIVNAPCTATPDTLPAADALRNPALHDALIDAFSMRNWHESRLSGHDQFFATFGRFSALPRRTGDMLAEAAARAAAGNVSYLELMQTLDGRAARSLGERVGWLGDFDAMHDALMSAGMAQAVEQARANLTAVEARRDTVLACGTAAAAAGCRVEVRWLYQVARANPPEQVFAQILMGFLVTQADPRVVGFNLVQPEDRLIAMRDYSLQMRMIGHLSRRYPGVAVSLHAGELASGLVPPEGLRSHVREAVEVAGARRIGHGVAVMHEDGAHDLLRTMAERGVLVEINLTSNDVILGVRGRDHPLHAYMAAGVPVALSTDDEGVARSEMTMEYLKAVQEQELGYVTLKTMARNSLQHAFVEGESLWTDRRDFTPVAECARPRGGLDGAACDAYVASSTRARLQRDMERAFARFETRQAAMTPTAAGRR